MASLPVAAERAWQTGILRDVKVERPKVSFGIGSAGPSGGRLPAPVRETRTYLIEAGDLLLEVKESTTADAPVLDAAVGDSVTFAIEKKILYLKEANGRERRLSFSRKPKEK